MVGGRVYAPSLSIGVSGNLGCAGKGCPIVTFTGCDIRTIHAALAGDIVAEKLSQVSLLQFAAIGFIGNTTGRSWKIYQVAQVLLSGPRLHVVVSANSVINTV